MDAYAVRSVTGSSDLGLGLPEAARGGNRFIIDNGIDKSIN
jgi:hypothetical protein